MSHYLQPLLAGAIVLAVTTTVAAQTAAAPPRVLNRTLSIVPEAGRQVFRLDARDGDGLAWWPDVAFTTGTIALDIRGRDVPQSSFVGIAFHGADEQTYEAITPRGQGAAAAPAAAPAMPAGAANLSGIYVGQILPDGGGDPFDGRFVIVDRGGAVEISLGPNADELVSATKVTRTGSALTFEADPPGETPNHLAFAVEITGDALTGTLVQTRDGQTRKGRLVFTKQ